MLNKLREPVNGLSHLFAAIAAVIGLIIMLVIKTEGTLKGISLLIYGLSLIVMFSASAAYHLINSGEKVTFYLRKLDHSAIFLLIAGTYTPICLHFFSGFWQYGLLIIVWSIALSGVLLKLFVKSTHRWISTGLYLIMGWLSVAAIKEITSTMSIEALIWFFSGGFFFTAGAVIYALKKPNFNPGVFGFHELWHIFVILGCFCHYVVIAAFVAPAG
ncbi:MAG: PAQR family membrane homeostasis protein TrhA [Bacillota bacterium]